MLRLEDGHLPARHLGGCDWWGGRGLCHTANMETHALSPPAAPAIAETDVPVWAWALVALAVVALYFVMLENGAFLGHAAGTLHEFFHDGRHIAGVPCH